MSSAAEFFDQEVIEGLEAIYKTDDSVQRRRGCVDVLQLQPGERVIDIGAGPGFVAYEMGQLVGSDGEVFGVDSNETMVQLARERCADQPWVSFKTADATQLPAPDATFDVAVSTQVFEYVPDVDAALAEMYRVLRPGGRGLIVASDWDSIIWNSSAPNRMEKVLSAFAEHCAHQTLPRTLASRLGSLGFEIRDVQARPQVNTVYDPNSFSFHGARLVTSFVPGRNGITETDAAEWMADLQQAGERGDYFFCLNQFLFRVEKPADA